MRVLIGYDGSASARAAIRFARLWIQAAQAEVTLLLVQESGLSEAALDAAEELLDGAAARVQRKLRLGRADEQIAAEATSADFDLVVIGSRGRRGLTRFLLGSTAANLARSLRTPLLIVPSDRTSLRRVLVCTGAEAPGEAVVEAARSVAGACQAEVTVLHVMSQIPMTDAAPDLHLLTHAEAAISQGSREGRHLQLAVDRLQRTAGVAAVTPKIREGLVVDEILAEISEGDYDLLVIGAHRTPPEWRPSRMAGLLLYDVADQIVSRSPRPVLVVRFDRGLERPVA